MNKSIDVSQVRLDDTQQQIFDLISKTNQCIFVQGQAGTGKSLLINYIRKHSNKKCLVCAPTALAAMLIEGSTIHSLFSLPISDYIQRKDLFKFKRDKLGALVRYANLLIIDEVSMVRPDILDAINFVLQAELHNDRPFGGLQVVLFGDLCQLPPIIRKDVKDIFADKYGHEYPYFFDSNIFREGVFKCFELREVYRQSDTELLMNLKRIRMNRDLNKVIDYFNTCLEESSRKLNQDATIITPYRTVADDINAKRLKKLTTKEYKYEAKKTGTCLKAKEFPAPETLKLKEGALVIFTKNNPGVWVNGSMGIVTKLTKANVFVKLLENGQTYLIEKEEWKSYKYDLDRKTGIVTQKEAGKYVQYPLQLGWSTTIHKAQGKTLDKVIIDFDKGTFTHGQAYVALSRTRNKEDIQLKTRLYETDIIMDDRIRNFLQHI